jgi:hypothetical protein
MDKSSMASNSGEPIVLRVDAVDQIFNAPDVNPFGKSDGELLGEAALDRLVLRLQVQKQGDLSGVPLVFALPADQITPDLEPQLAAAIQRYCAARIEDNQLEIRRSRLQHGFGLAVVFLVVLVVMVIVVLLLTTVLAGLPQTVQGLITGALCVFTWVILWDPLEALLFDWVAPTRENRSFAKIMQMRVAVQPQE